MIKRIQVYGQRCSGTNALIKLIENNFPELVFTEEFGFKHWLVPTDTMLPDDVLIVIIARDPHQWLRSVYRTPWHAHPDLKALPFSDFIRAPWISVWDEDFWGITHESACFGKPIKEERCPVTGRPFDNVIAMRTAKLANWIEVASRARASAFLSHAMLVLEPVATLERIAKAASLPTARDWELLTSYKGAGAEPFVPKRYPPLSLDDRQHVAAFLDDAIEARFANRGDGSVISVRKTSHARARSDDLPTSDPYNKDHA